MTTSASVNFSLNRNELIRASMRRAGILASAEVPNNDEYADASIALNIMLKQWQQHGIGLWLNQSFDLFLDYGTYYYLLGATGGNATASSTVTQVATAAVTTDLTITVDSITGIAASDIIGVQLDDGTLQWTTVNGAPAAGVVTITAALTDDVAVDNWVYTYTAKIQRPVEIVELRRYDANSGVEVPIVRMSRQEYQSLSLKTASGTPTQYYYDPQLTNGVLYLWPAPDSVEYYIKGTMRRSIYDMDATDDDFDIPPEIFGAVRDCLAYNLGIEFDVPAPKMAILQAEYARSFDLLQNWDSEPTSVFFQPATR